jgi:hypothetical protein
MGATHSARVPKLGESSAGVARCAWVSGESCGGLGRPWASGSHSVGSVGGREVERGSRAWRAGEAEGDKLEPRTRSHRHPLALALTQNFFTSVQPTSQINAKFVALPADPT